MRQRRRLVRPPLQNRASGIRSGNAGGAGTARRLKTLNDQRVVRTWTSRARFLSPAARELPPGRSARADRPATCESGHLTLHPRRHRTGLRKGLPPMDRACAQGSGRYARGPRRRPTAAAHAPEPMAGNPGPSGPKPRQRPRRAQQKPKGTAGRLKPLSADRAQSFSIVLLPTVEPPSVLDPCGSRIASRSMSGPSLRSSSLILSSNSSSEAYPSR
jgi:hypothetical protein